MNEGEIKSLTGLRGIAAWIVVVYHFRDVFREQYPALEFLLSFGFYAVDVFFILSGFVICLSANRYFWGSSLKQVLGRFYSDRFARIYPLHFAVLLLYLLNPIAIRFFSGSGLVPDRYDPLYYVASLLLVQNWGVFDQLKWNIPAWSISTEFAAYLLFPVVFYLVSLVRSRGFLLLLFLLLLLLIAWTHEFFEIASLGSDISRFGVVRCLLEFSLGVLLARFYLLGFISFKPFGGGVVQFLACVSLVALIYFGVPDYLFVPLLLTILVASLIDQGIISSRILSLRFFSHMGVLSYSIYIVHYWIKDWVKFLSPEVGYAQFSIYILSTYLVALVMHKALEIRLRDFLRSRLGRLYSD